MDKHELKWRNPSILIAQFGYLDYQDSYASVKVNGLNQNDLYKCKVVN